MAKSKYAKELAEMTELWNCDERTAIQQFLHTIYILRGCSPKDTGSFINHMSDDELVRCFTSFMDDRFNHKEIDLLAIQPTRI